VRLTVRAKPRAKVSRILRADGLSVDVAVAAPPVDGAANEELLSVLADALSVPRRSVRLSVGGGSKNKVVDVFGLAAADVIRRLAKAATSPRR
jgi:uncharacterized protein YggU (UPF0235/DUF167 family)